MPNTLVQLLYISNSTPELDQRDIDAILAKSRENNPARKISGLLIYADGIFIQVLEGPAEHVHQLFETISDDKRHSHLEVVSEYAVPERLFSNWSMAFVSTSRDELSKITGGDGVLDRNDIMGLLAADQSKSAMFLREFVNRLN